MKVEEREELLWLLVGTVGSAVAGIIVGWITKNIYAVVAVGVLSASIIHRLKRIRRARREKRSSGKGRGASSRDLCP